MKTKTELIADLKALLKQEDPEQVADEVDTVKDAYEALVHKAEDDAKAQAAEGEDGAEEDGISSEREEHTPIESAVLTDEEDREFKQLLDSFNQRLNDIKRERTKQENANLKEKEALLAEMDALIQEEENIGSAFEKFRKIQEKWQQVGNVPQHKYRELQNEYTHRIDTFFYNIRIYKELREHDLKKNTGLKQALISDMRSLLELDSVKEMETRVKFYQDKWHQVGPVVREEWEQIRDEFWNATRSVYEKIHEYYQARRVEHEANLEAKKHLVEKTRQVVLQAKETGGKEWKNLTDQVLELQNAWKNIGFATKKENEKVWKEFRQTCNEFFDLKHAYFNKLKETFKEARDKKQALIEKAEALKESTAWKDTAEELKVLQRTWKDAGSAGHRDEHRLWMRFRAACDHFFQSRKEHFKEQDKEQEENLKSKKVLLEEMKAFELSGDKGKDLAVLKEFGKRWNVIGRVPRDHGSKMNEAYRKALEGLFSKLDMDEAEKARMRMEEKVQSIRNAPDSKKQLDKERSHMQRRIKDLEAELLQFERSMGMFNFSSKNGEVMKRDMEKKMERTRREIEKMKLQQRELIKELK